MATVHRFGECEEAVEFLRRERPEQLVRVDSDLAGFDDSSGDTFYIVGKSREELTRAVVKYVYGLDAFGVEWCTHGGGIPPSWEMTGVPEFLRTYFIGVLESPRILIGSPEYKARAAELAKDPGVREPGVPADCITRKEAEGRVWAAWDDFLSGQVNFFSSWQDAVDFELG